MLASVEASGVSISARDIPDPVEVKLQESTSSRAEHLLDDGVKITKLSSELSRASIACWDEMRRSVSWDMMIPLILCLVRPEIHAPLSR